MTHSYATQYILNDAHHACGNTWLQHFLTAEKIDLVLNCVNNTCVCAWGGGGGGGE